MRLRLLTTAVGLLLFPAALWAQISSLPYTEGFESTHGFTFSGSLNSWDADTLSGTGFYVAYQGVGAMGTDLTGSYNNSEYSYATSPVFDFSALTLDPVLSFYGKYTIESGFDDLSVQVSVDSGATWSTLGSSNSDPTTDWALNWYNKTYNWDGTQSSYVQMQHVLTNCAGYSAVQFRFFFDSDGSVTYDGALIDDIVVFAQPDFDIQLTGVGAVVGAAFDRTGTDTVYVDLRNGGQNAVSDIPVVLLVTGPGGTTDSLTATVPSMGVGSYAQVRFTTDLSAVGAYQLLGYHSLDTDELMANDTAWSEVFTAAPATGGLPYAQNFETTTATQYTQSAIVDSAGGVLYQVDGTGRLSMFYYGFEGNQTACLDGQYGENDLIIGLDLSSYAGSGDQLFLNFGAFNVGDEYNVQDGVFVRGNQTDDWTEIYDWQSQLTNGDGYTMVNALNLTETLAALGQDFSASTQIRFSQYDNLYISSDGFCVDEVSVVESNTDLEISSGSIHADLFTPTGADSATFRMTNLGIDTITQIPVAYTLYGPVDTVTGADTLTLNLAPDGLNDYTIGGLDFTTVGSYTLVATVAVAGDALPYNDSYTIYHSTLEPAPIPYLETFDNEGSIILTTPGVVGNTGLYYNPVAGAGPFRTQYTSAYTYNNTVGGAWLSGAGINELSLTLDLAGKDVNTDLIYLSFYATMFYEEITEGVEGFWVRGSSTEEWVLLGDWHDLTTSSFVNTASGPINLSAALAAAGQAFSGTTQVKFVQVGNYGLYSDGVVLDQISVLQPTVDMAVTGGWLQANTFAPTGADTATFALANLGLDTLLGVGLGYTLYGPVDTITVADSLADVLVYGDSLSYTIAGLDLTAPGDYRLTLTVDVPGDELMGNNTYTLYHSTRPVMALPYAQDFDSDSVGAITLAAPGLVGNTGWFYNPAEGSGPFRTQYSTYYTYQNSVGGAWLGGNGTNELSIALDLAGKDVATDSVYLSFMAATFNEEVDAGEGIFVKGSEDDEWVFLYDWHEVPLYNYTLRSSVPLNLSKVLAEAGQQYSATTQVKFVQQGIYDFYSDGLLLDRVRITDQNYDPAIYAAATNPNGTKLFAHNFDEYTVTVGNEGDVAIDTLRLEVHTYQGPDSYINDSLVMVNLPLNLAAGQYEEVSLADYIPYMGSGIYQLRLTVRDTADMNLINNGTYVSYFKVVDFVNELPYTTSFEDSTAYFEMEDDWDIGMPAGTVIDTAYDGVNAAVTNLTGFYGQYYVSDALYTPVFDLSLYTADPVLSFALQHELSTDDYLVVEYSTNGSSWTKLGTANYATESTFGENWYNDATLNAWTGSSNDTIFVAQHEVPNVAGEPFVQLRWRLYSYYGGVAEGVMIDQVSLTAQQVTDLALMPINDRVTVSYAQGTETLNLQVGLVNTGFTDITNPSVTLMSSDSTTTSFAYTGTLTRGDTVILDLTTVTIDADYEYHIVLDSTIADEIDRNNSVDYGVILITPDTLPYHQTWNYLGYAVREGRIPYTTNGVAETTGDAYLYTNYYEGSDYSLSFTGNGEAAAVFTFDMAGVSTTEVAYLSFEGYHSGITNSAQNAIFVRGSETDNWLMVSTFADLVPTTYQYKYSGLLDLSAVLANGGQSYSRTTQVRIMRNDYQYDYIRVAHLRLEVPGIDFGPRSVTPPADLVEMSANETISVTVRNYGQPTTATVDVTLTALEPDSTIATYTQSVTQTWGALEDVVVDFTGVDLSQLGRYGMRVSTAAANDANGDNDTIAGELFNQTLITDFPYFESFENGPAGYFTSGTNSSWEHGIPAATNISTAGNGEKAWVTNLDGWYNSEELSYLNFPVLDLSGWDEDPVLSFLVYWDTYNISDQVRVEVSTDGENWEMLGLRSEDAAANDSLIYSWYTSIYGWYGSSTTTVYASHPLAGLAGQSRVFVRVVMDASYFSHDEGVMIDMVQISGNINQAPELAVQLNDAYEPVSDSTVTLPLSNRFWDPDGDVLTYSVTVADPTVASVASINSDSLVMNLLSAGSTDVTVTVMDPDSLTAFDTFLLIADGIPVVDSLIPDTVYTGAFTWYLPLYSFFNDDYGTLTFDVAVTNDTAISASLNGSTLTLTEGSSQGSSLVTITATDLFGQSATTTFTVGWADPVPTVVNPVPDSTFHGTMSWTLDFTSIFDDAENTAALSYAFTIADTQVVQGLRNGNFVSLSEGSTHGTTTITLTATDAQGQVATVNFVVTINGLPTWVAANDSLILQRGFGTHTVDLSTLIEDPEGSTLTYSVFSHDQFVVAASVSGSTLTLTEDGLGTTTVDITTTDSLGASVTFGYAVQVIAGPEVAQQLADTTLQPGFNAVTYQLSEYFTDLDTEPAALTYQVLNNTNTAIVNAFIGNVSELFIEEVDGGIGETTLTLMVTDENGLSASQSFTLLVNSTPVANPMDSLLLGINFVDTTFSISHVFGDADNHELVYRATLVQQGVVNVNMVGDMLTVTEIGGTVGDATVILTATDIWGAVASTELHIEVDPVNYLPELAGEWKVYPVPASEQLTVQLSLERASEVSLRVTDATGRTHVQQALGMGTEFSHTLPVAEWPAGVWFVTVVVDGVPYTRTVVKQ